MSEDMKHDTSQPPAQDEISDYYDGIKQLELQGYASGVKKARTALFVTAVLLFIGELLSVELAGFTITPSVIAISLVESGIFVGLALWTKTKPYTAIITGLVVFIALWILAIVVSGFRGAIGGIIVRVVIISYLISALKPAKAWEEAKKRG